MSPEIKKAALAEYLDECQEMLERLSKNLNFIEKSGGDNNILAAVYRDMHTIKGTSQLFGFSKIGQLAHVMETCLDPVRKGNINMSYELLTQLYSGMDFITLLLQGVRQTGNELDVIVPLEEILAKFISITESSLTGLNPLIKDKIIPNENIFENSVYEKQEVITSVPIGNKNEIEKEAFCIFDDIPEEKPVIIAKSPPIVPPTETPTAPVNHIEPKETETIRVQVSILDTLMNLVGELVLIRNQLLQHTKLNDEDTEFLKLSQRLNSLTAELQNEVMKTRMQPIGNVFNMFSRVVRDVSKELSKKIDLDLEGLDTELDKTILEAVKDPLMHIVRNALDHGIEQIEERKKLGKKEIALIKLTAYHESGQVIIEVTDDGRGLDREKIGAKAVEKGLTTMEALAKMNEKEVQLFIFAPGFSTAASISNISGRGVGMDVVKTNIEKIGGIVDILSKVGTGTTIKMKIPLSLAIVPALIVWANGQRFAIPQTKLVELLRIEKSNNTAEKIESLQGKPVLRLRGKLLPIISLSEVLLLQNKDNKTASAFTIKTEFDEEVLNIVVLNADGHFFGLIVDEIDDSVDIVVKSLSQFLKDLKAFSGATIMGDGTVALTIDVIGISETAGLSADPLESVSYSKENELKTTMNYRSENCDILLIDIGAPESYAIPLAIVSRIEEFENIKFEYSGEQKVIQYRNSLLPIFSLPHFLQLPFQAKHQDNENKIPVVVIKRGDHLYGIEVFQIQDIIEISSNINLSVRDRPGILGTAVTNERVIVLVDILTMIDTLKSKLEINNHHNNETNINIPSLKKINDRGHYRILIAEDSSFFRNYIQQILQEAGYHVEVACDGQEALNLLTNAPPDHFSLILSDIEMPIIDGYEFARKVRALQVFVQLPMCAVTTRFSNSDIEQGRLAGFNHYFEKLNAETLLANIDKILCTEQKIEVKKYA